jgi:hypothetical protein
MILWAPFMATSVEKSPPKATPFNEQLRTSSITSLACHLQTSSNLIHTRIVKRRLPPAARMSPSPKYHRRLACVLPYPRRFSRSGVFRGIGGEAKLLAGVLNQTGVGFRRPVAGLVFHKAVIAFGIIDRVETKSRRECSPLVVIE